MFESSAEPGFKRIIKIPVDTDIMRVDETFINSLTIPDEEWTYIDITLNKNETEVFERKAFDKTFFEIDSSKSNCNEEDTCNIDLERSDANMFENEMENIKEQDVRNIELKRLGDVTDEMDIDDTDEFFTCNSTTTKSTLKPSRSTMTMDSSYSSCDDFSSNTTEIFAINVRNMEDALRSAQLSLQLPSLTSSELDLKLEQTASRLNISIKKSEMSRQTILQNGSALYQTLMNASFNGSYPAAIGMMAQSRKAVGSYASRKRSKTI